MAPTISEYEQGMPGVFRSAGMSERNAESLIDRMRENRVWRGIRDDEPAAVIPQRATSGNEDQGGDIRNDTLIALREILSSRLYYNVGSTISHDDVQVHTWTDACDLARSRDFDAYLLELRNALNSSICNVHRERYRQSWNSVVLELRPPLTQHITAQLVSARIPEEGVDVVLATSRWCLLCYCLEWEYRDVVQLDHFQRLWLIFRAGHFPCGTIERNGERALAIF